MQNSLENVLTYVGYDEKGTEIVRKRAASALDYFNPSDVSKAIETVKTALNKEIGNITAALDPLVTDAAETVIVQGTKMDKTLSDYIESIKSLPEIIGGQLDPIIDEIVKKHNSLQKEYNAEVRALVQGTAGVTNIRSV